MSAKLKDGIITVFADTKEASTFEVAKIPTSLHAQLAAIAVQRIMREMTAGKGDTPELRSKAVASIHDFWIRVQEGKLDVERTVKSAIVSPQEIAAMYVSVIARARVASELAKDPKSKLTTKDAAERFLALSPERRTEIMKQFDKAVKAEVRVLTAARTAKTDF